MLAGSGLLAARTAQGQEQPASPPAAAIVVSGTRIRSPSAAGLEPVQVLDAARLQDRGQTNVAEAIDELPGFRGAATPAGPQPTFGQGMHFINLFGLGTNRTLVLIDGQRLVSSSVPSTLGNGTPGSQADLNVVPEILIDRIEQVAVGGAPVYGSDAIAGTVNLVLRRRFRGLDLRATSGLTGEGDNLRRNLSALGGFDFAGGRGNLTAAVSWDTVAGVTGQARAAIASGIAAISNPCAALSPGLCSAGNLAATLGPAGRTPANDGRLNPAIGFNTSANDGIPASVYVRDVTIPAVATGGVLASGAGAYSWRFDASGQLVPYDRGVLYNAPLAGPLAAAALASGGDGLRAADFVSIASDQQRLNGHLFATFEVSERLGLFADAMVYHGSARTLVRQPTYNATLFSGVSGALGFRLDNPFLVPQARAQLQALGYANGFQVSRANPDLVDLAGQSDSRIVRIVAGARGRLALAGHELGWELTANYGRTDVTDRIPQIDEQRFVNAVNVTTVAGRIACSASATVTGLPAGMGPIADPACVPLDLFGQGAASAAALAYIRHDTVSRSRLEQFVVNANLGGALALGPGNPVSFNVGLEHHAERGRFSPDPFLQAGLGRAGAVSPTAGQFSTDEAFGEALVPLVTPANRRAGIDRLELFARIRRVVGGQNRGFTAFALGGTLAPTGTLAFRGNVTRSFRAPSLVEAYSPASPVRVSVPDLCAPATIASGAAPAVRQANCAAFLAAYPLATPLAAASATVPGLAGGNPGLRDERAQSWTAGVVLRLPRLAGLMLSTDYVSFTIRDPIASLGIGQIASGCFDNPDFNAADPAHGNRFCAMIPRDGNGQVLSDPLHPGVFSGYVNGQSIRMRGAQAALSWLRPLGPGGGTLALEGSLFWLRERLVDLTGVAPAASDGIVGDPHWQGLLRLAYASSSRDRAGRGAALLVHYTGGQAISASNRGPSPNDVREIDHFRGYATFDLSLFVMTRVGLRVSGSVTNLFDRVGQRYQGAVIPASINDPLGRRFTLGVERRW